MPLIIGGFVGLSFLILLAAKYAFHGSRAERNDNPSAVGVQESKVVGAFTEKTREGSRDSDTGGSIHKREMEGKKGKKMMKWETRQEENKSKMIIPKSDRPKAVQILPASFAATSSTQSFLPHSGAFAPSIETSSSSWQQNAFTQGPSPVPRVMTSHSGASGQIPGKCSSANPSRNNFFKTCQQQVNLWKYIVVEEKDVQRGALLGRGAYAEVYKGQALGTDCAIKVYRATASPEQLEEAMGEIRIAASFDHPCTLRVLGWVQKPLQTIMELCYGDIKAFYSDKIEELQYSEMEALRILRVGLGVAARS